MPAFPIAPIESRSAVPQVGLSSNPMGAASALASSIGGLASGVLTAVDRQNRQREMEAREARALVDRQQREEAMVQTVNATGRMTLQLQSLLDDAETSPAGAAGLGQRVATAMEDMTLTERPTVNEAGQNHFDLSAAQLRQQFMQRAQAIEVKGRQVAVVDQIRQSGETAAQIVARDHDQWPLQLAQQEAMIDASSTLPEVRAQLRRDAHSTLTTAAAEGMLERHPGALLAGLNHYFGVGSATSAPAAAPVAADAPRGVRNNNPGNVRAGSDAWQGMTGSDGEYGQFVSPEAGLRAMSRNLMSYGGHGIDTLSGVVNRWAPASENDTAAYLRNVSKATGFSPDARIDLHDPAVLAKLVPAIVKQENGQQPYSAEQIRVGIDAALGRESLPELAAPTTLTAQQAQAFLDGNQGHGDARLPFLNALPPDQALRMRNAALAEVQRQQGEMRAGLESRTKDYQAMVSAGVAPPPGSAPTPTEYAAAYGEGAAERYGREVATYTRLGSALSELQDGSFADRQGVIARATPQPGPGFDQQQHVLHALVEANKTIERRLAEDPAAFAQQTSPRVQAASQAMGATMSDQTASPAKRAAAVDQFVAAATAEQQRLGVDRIGADALGEAGKARQPGVRLLTNGQANAIAEQFHNDPAKGVELMDGLQAQWGKHWPTVYAQLAQDGKLPPAALVIPNMSDPFAKATLARLSDLKLQKDLEAGLPPGVKNDIAAKLQQQNEPFWTSLQGQGGGERTYMVVKGQQEVLASSYVMQGHSPADAARMAFEQTVGHAYQFADTMRIPRTEQPTTVLKGTAAIVADPSRLPSEAPQSFRPELAAKDRQAAWVDVIKSGASWVTNADETGAMLYVQGRSAGGAPAPFAVRGRDGQPLTWTWAQLRAAAATAPAPTTGKPLGGGPPSRRGDAIDQAIERARAAAGER